jgi:hypothetical protein
MSFIIRYLSGQTAIRVTFALTFLNNDYLVKGVAVVKCTEWHSYTLVRLRGPIDAGSIISTGGWVWYYGGGNK